MCTYSMYVEFWNLASKQDVSTYINSAYRGVSLFVQLRKLACTLNVQLHTQLHTYNCQKRESKLIASCITELKRTAFCSLSNKYSTILYIQSTCQGRFLKNKGDWCSIYVESQNMTLRLSLSCFRSALWGKPKNLVFNLSSSVVYNNKLEITQISCCQLVTNSVISVSLSPICSMFISQWKTRKNFVSHYFCLQKWYMGTIIFYK